LGVEQLKFEDRLVNLPGASGVIMGGDGDDARSGAAGNDVIRAGAGSAPFAIDILDPAKGYWKADLIFGGQ
jgi:hypothetical protein